MSLNINTYYNSSGSAKYRWGFNGKEKDDNWQGGGNSYDYGFRIYNPRLGRFLSVDPLSKDYPQLSSYQYGSNRPIDGIDVDGAEWKSKNKWTDPINEKHLRGKALISKLTDEGVYVPGMTYADAWKYRAGPILERMYEEGQVLDCFDAAVKAVIEFAAFYELPFSIEDYKAPDEKGQTDPSFDNDAYGYTNKKGEFIKFNQGDWEGLAKAVAAYYGAADAYNDKNLTVPTDEWKTGTLLISKTHILTITEVDEDLFSNDYEYIQGDLDENRNPVKLQKKEHEGAWFSIFWSEGKPRKWNFKNFDQKQKESESEPKGKGQ